jgi:serine/threonine protein phosphatase PrpC
MGQRYSYVRMLASNRERSEDAAEVFERDDAMVVVLADGAGGIRGGAMASGALVTAVSLAVEDRAFALSEPQSWAELLRATDASLASNRSGETTGVVIVLGDRGLIGVSTGDSEAWIVGSTQIDDLTVGQDTKRRLGSGRVAPTTFERPAFTGVLVVATDGLFKYASGDVIARIVRAGAIGTAAEQLVELVRLRSGSMADDVAVVLVAQSSGPGVT